jgi:hypothetical protein
MRGTSYDEVLAAASVKCTECGGVLHAVPRTFLERFKYMAVFECENCGVFLPSPRPYLLHFGPHCRCPICGTYKVSRLRGPDIDREHGGLLDRLERWAGGGLHHCRYCRIQFHDRRPTQPPPPGQP